MAKPRRMHKDCPNCNGWFLKDGTWKQSRNRYTVGVICPICGHDYMKEVKTSGETVPPSTGGH